MSEKTGCKFIFFLRDRPRGFGEILQFGANRDWIRTQEPRSRGVSILTARGLESVAQGAANGEFGLRPRTPRNASVIRAEIGLFPYFLGGLGERMRAKPDYDR